MTSTEAKQFLARMRLTTVNRMGSNYDCDRYLRVETSPESPWDKEGMPGGADDTKAKFEEAVRALTET